MIVKLNKEINGLGNEFDMDNIFFISDTHFGHENIIRYCDRPFNNVDEMDNYIIQKWNSVINNSLIIFHLGDFAFGNIFKIKEYIDQLNGIKVLIVGNHDKRIKKNKWRKLGFVDVFDQLKIEYGDNIFYLTHRPLDKYEINTIDKIHKNLHGHIHNYPTKDPDFHINLSVENINYEPISLVNILEKCKYDKLI